MSESHIGIPLLQPFCFTNPGKWSDGFNEHGIFEIVGLDELTGRVPKATVRRIASFKIDCVIGEVVKIPTHRIKSRAVRTSLQSFSEHADFDQLTAAQSQITHLENVNQRLVAFSANNTRELQSRVEELERGNKKLSEAMLAAQAESQAHCEYAYPKIEQLENDNQRLRELLRECDGWLNARMFSDHLLRVRIKAEIGE